VVEDGVGSSWDTLVGGRICGKGAGKERRAGEWEGDEEMCEYL